MPASPSITASVTSSNSETGSVPATPSVTRSRTASTTHLTTQSVTRTADVTRSRTISRSAGATATRTKNTNPSPSPSYRPVAPVRLSFSTRFAFSGSGVTTQPELAVPLARQAKKDITCALAQAVAAAVPGAYYDPTGPNFSVRSNDSSLLVYLGAMIDGASGLRVPFFKGDYFNNLGRLEYYGGPCPDASSAVTRRRILRSSGSNNNNKRRSLQEEVAGESVTFTWVVEVNRPAPAPASVTTLLATDPTALNTWERNALTSALNAIKSALQRLTSRDTLRSTMSGAFAVLSQAPYEVTSSADVEVGLINATLAGTAADPFFVAVEDPRDFSSGGGGGGGSSNSGVGAAIGGAVGGVLLGLGLLAGCFYYHRKKQVDAANAAMAAANASANSSGGMHTNKLHGHSKTSLLSDQPAKKKPSDVGFDSAFGSNSEESRASSGGSGEENTNFGQSNPLSRLR